MTTELLWHRIQFAFTVTYHYLFPQLTMGLVLLKVRAIRTSNQRYNELARFWGRIFGLNFAMGVVTGIPLEFQFGTNWARFSSVAGEVIGQTLALEGVFAFILESAFLGLFLFGEKRLGPRGHLAVALALFAGSWLSGYFIIATNAFMQHPVGYAQGEDGAPHLEGFWAFLLNPWALWQYAHNMTASVITASFVMSAVGAYWSLMGMHSDHARICLRVGVIAGLLSSVLVAFPTGDSHGKLLARHQPAALAAAEGLFDSGPYAELAIIGQPNVKDRKLENPIVVPGVLSFLAYGTFGSTVKGLNDFPESEWPDNVELLYYAYHIMVGLGTLFILAMAASAFLLWRNRLQQSRRMLWVLMLAFPFPYRYSRPSGRCGTATRSG
jgi:cytochrome d ubiquinol oxidase subunit I